MPWPRPPRRAVSPRCRKRGATATKARDEGPELRASPVLRPLGKKHQLLVTRVLPASDQREVKAGLRNCPPKYVGVVVERVSVDRGCTRRLLLIRLNVQARPVVGVERRVEPPAGHQHSLDFGETAHDH